MHSRIEKIAEELRSELLGLSHIIHANPETAFEEHKAVVFQKELLEKHGFKVETPFCDLPTAYRASFPGRKDGPVVAFIAEYDALRDIGHACGHNIIASVAAGAAIALSKAAQELQGEIQVIGSPAEETGGGKVFLVERGAFHNVDFAMMIHPGTENLYGRGGIAATHVDVEFFGKASHAVEPRKGINALTSMLEYFNSLNGLRQTWDKGHVLTGIITNGGKAPNVVPDYTSASFVPRSPTKKGLFLILEDMERAAKAVALLTGAEYAMKYDVVYAERHPNIALGERFRDNMSKLGETVVFADARIPLGSSDIGNVSLELPTIHEYIAIADDSTTSHSDRFREAAVSPRGDEAVLLGTKALAMTAWDVFSDPELRERAIAEYREKVFPFKS
jgi:amidohydrolase